MTKTCRRCHQDLPLSSFGRDKTAADGLWCVCHECFRANVVALKGADAKHCHVCQEAKPFSEFPRYRREADGLHQCCRACAARTALEYYHRNLSPNRPPKPARPTRADKLASLHAALDARAAHRKAAEDAP